MRILPVCLDFLYLITKKGCYFKKITAKFGSIMQYCLLKPLCSAAPLISQVRHISTLYKFHQSFIILLPVYCETFQLRKAALYLASSLTQSQGPSKAIGYNSLNFQATSSRFHMVLKVDLPLKVESKMAAKTQN